MLFGRNQEIGFLKRLSAVAFPEALILLAAVVFLRMEWLHQDAASEIRLYPIAVFIVGAVLSLRFHQSRMLLVLMLLALADRSLALTWSADASHMVAGQFTFQAVAILLPLNLAVLALLPERDTLSPEGIIRLSIIALQVIGIFLIRDKVPAFVVDAIMPSTNGSISWTPLGILALIAFIVAFVILVISLATKTDAVHRGFLWSAVAVFLAVNSDFDGFAPTFLFATTGLIIVVAVIESSYSMAYQDGLTGLPSRRALNQALTRLGGTFTIAMVDVDHFKRFNDEHGHDVGDQVLRKVAAAVQQVTGGGKAFRYGGEEFAVLFRRKTSASSVPHLERVRQRIQMSDFTLRRDSRPIRKPKHPVSPTHPTRLSITVSIGAAQRQDHYDKPDDVIRRADEALYRAKESGRNRVKVSED